MAVKKKQDEKTAGVDAETWAALQRQFKVDAGYTGPIDGELNDGTVEAIKKFLASRRRYNGEPMDTDAQLWAAIQRWLRDAHGYAGVIDGVVDQLTIAAMRHAASLPVGRVPASKYPPLDVDGEDRAGLWARLQLWLGRDAEYDGAADGEPGKKFWSSLQAKLDVDVTGSPDVDTWSALQDLLRRHGYEGLADGESGPLTIAALQRFANTII